MSTLSVSINSTQEELNKVYASEEGTVIRIEGYYGSVLELLQDNVPQGLIFEVFEINPGTCLYALYGPNHIVVTKRAVQNDL